MSIRRPLKYLLFVRSLSLISKENLSFAPGDFEAYPNDKRSGVSVRFFNCVCKITFLDFLSVVFDVTEMFKPPSVWKTLILPSGVQACSLSMRFVPMSSADPLDKGWGSIILSRPNSTAVVPSLSMQIIDLRQPLTYHILA